VTVGVTLAVAVGVILAEDIDRIDLRRFTKFGEFWRAGEAILSVGGGRSDTGSKRKVNYQNI
jgi:hypothetical protein